MSATVTVPPPSSDLEICTGAPKRGEFSHGAPVWAVWYSSVGTHGRNRISAPVKPIITSLKNARRSSLARNGGTSETIRPAVTKMPQLCV